MTEYIVKIGFWLHAYDSITIDADSEAIEQAKVEAKSAIEAGFYSPEHIEFGQPREGVIGYIDRIIKSGREAIVESVEFDDDRIHPLPERPARTAPEPRAETDD